MSNIFSCEVSGAKLYFDPLKIRRVLLQNTDGRCWTYIRNLQQHKVDLDELKVEEAKPENDEKRQAQLESLIAINLKATADIEGILARAAMEAFEFVPFDVTTGQGVGEEAALIALQAFMEYAEGKD